MTSSILFRYQGAPAAQLSHPFYEAIFKWMWCFRVHMVKRFILTWARQKRIYSVIGYLLTARHFPIPVIKRCYPQPQKARPKLMNHAPLLSAAETAS